MSDEILKLRELRAAYPASAGSSKRSARLTAVRDVDLSIDRGHFFTLLGPSGCGKTTLLRCVAGLHRPEAGSVSIAGRTVFSHEERIDVPPNRRRVGMVFQSHAVWPHLDVFSNVAFPLESLPRGDRPRPDRLRERVRDALEMVELADLAHRPASRLSGGQQQRLALARALVGEPDLLLLDEPLSNLDARLRATMRLEVKRLQREVGVTVLYVTHDQDEALAMSTTVAVMSEGGLAQMGTPEQIYHRPENRFVATFVGRANVLPGRLQSTRAGGHCVETAAGPLWADDHGTEVLPAEVVAVIRPEDVEVSKDSGRWLGHNTFAGQVRDVGFRGDVLDVVFEVEGAKLEARLLPDPDLVLVSGDKLTVHLPPRSIRLLPA